MTDPDAGDSVDVRYELRRLVARGGMALVFEAHHKFTRRTVALKLLPEELRHHSEFRGRLMREALALTTVRHQGFVEVLDAGVCATFGPYVVLEMLEGRTLDGILAAKTRLAVSDAVHVGRQVCEAIAFANARGVVHRDIKPSNLFIARSEIGEERVKIIDLGVAAIEEERLKETDRKLTASHEVIGTPEYMAPEQLFGKAVDARTDVYAIGMTLFECLTGEVPYLGTYPEVIVQVSNASEPPSVRARRDDVPLALATVIEHAMEKDASDRFQAALELGRALVAASGLGSGHTLLLASSGEEAPIALVKRKPRAQGDDAPPSGRERPPQRRHFVRAPYVTPARLMSMEGEVETRCEEISEEGMLVISPRAFELGTEVRVHLALPGSGTIDEVGASVRWTRDARGRTAVGLEYTSVNDACRKMIAAYIAAAASTTTPTPT